MLKKSKKTKGANTSGRYVIVASKYNGRYVNSMLKAARAELKTAGAEEVRVVRVPGAYEIPVVAGALARQAPRWDAIICLGVILRGATTHAQHIGDAVSLALAEIQVREGVPVIHEVLLFENVEQAKVRCLDKEFNRSNEAAQTALEMARVMCSL